MAGKYSDHWNVRRIFPSFSPSPSPFSNLARTSRGTPSSSCEENQIPSPSSFRFFWNEILSPPSVLLISRNLSRFGPAGTPKPLQKKLRCSFSRSNRDSVSRSSCILFFHAASMSMKRSSREAVSAAKSLRSLRASLEASRSAWSGETA